MQFSSRIFALVVGAILALGHNATADQTHLKDGSVLVGTVQKLAEAKLHINTDFGGELAIPWEQIEKVATDATVVVQLQSGDRVVGTLSIADGKQFISSPTLGDIALTLTDVTAVWPEGETSPMEVAAQAEAQATIDAKVEELEKAQLKLNAVWNGRAEFGLNGQSGNKERVDVRLGIDINRKTPTERLNLYLKGQYAETNSEKSANEVMGGARIEVDISERTYVFAKVDLEYDEFEDLDLRATVTGGLGHFFIEKEKLELKGWVGIGYEHETFSVDPEPLPTPTSYEEALRQAITRASQEDNDATTMDEVVVELGYNYRQDFGKNFRIKHGITYYPSIDDPFSEYRLAADTAVEFPLGKEPDWTLRAGVRNEYDAKPRKNIDSLDTTYYLNLGYNW